MKIYVQPKVLDKSAFIKLQASFPEVMFVHDGIDALDCEGLITYPQYVKIEHLAPLKQLKWIQLMTAGFDGIDFDYLQQRNIILTNAKDVYDITIAEDVMCKILVLNRNVRHYLTSMDQKVWQPISHEPEIAGSTVGILGTGGIAKAIAKRMQAFEATVIGYRKTNKPVPFFDHIYYDTQGLQQLIQASDYIIITLPLNEATRHLIDADMFRLMKKNAVLINIARGDIIVQKDLIEALELGLIRGAGLDVTTPEPLPEDSALWRFKNVFITPHNATSSPFIYDRLAKAIAINIRHYLDKTIDAESII